LEVSIGCSHEKSVFVGARTFTPHSLNGEYTPSALRHNDEDLAPGTVLISQLIARGCEPHATCAGAMETTNIPRYVPVILSDEHLFNFEVLPNTLSVCVGRAVVYESSAMRVSGNVSIALRHELAVVQDFTTGWCVEPPLCHLLTQRGTHP